MADEDDERDFGRPLGITELLKLLWRHGQYLLVYPAAFQGFRTSNILTPAMAGIPYMAPLLRTPDGIDLSCYLLPQTCTTLSLDHQHNRSGSIEDVRVELTPAASDARATVIVFHGNAMHHWEDMQSAVKFFAMRCNVFLLSYRGYSLSSGTPNEKGLRIDAQTALDYVLDQPHLAKTPIVLYGHSLGGGVAIDLASRNPSKISSVIVSNTFTSIPDIVRRWPVIGVFSFVCHQKWNSAKKMRHIPSETPILMLSGRKDEVVHPELMDKLWEAAKRRRIKVEAEREQEQKQKQKREQQEKQKWKWMKSSMTIFEWAAAGKKERKSQAQTDSPPAHDVFVKIEGGTHDETLISEDYWIAIEKFIRKESSRRQKEGERKGHASILVSSPMCDARPVPTRRWRYSYQNHKIVVLDGDLV